MNDLLSCLATQYNIPLSLVVDLKSFILNQPVFNREYTELSSTTVATKTNSDLDSISFTAIAGLSGTNWKIKLGENTFLAREINVNKAELGINRVIEYDILDSISDLQIAPRPLYLSDNWLFVEWLESDFNTNELTLAQLEISSLAALIAKIHSQKSIAPVLDIVKRFKYLYTFISPTRSSKVLHMIHNYFICSPPPTHSKLVLAHMDIHLGNLVVNKGILKLIDWEYAATVDEHLALAVTIDALKLDHTRALDLLSFYNSYVNLPLSRKDLIILYDMIMLWHPYILYLQLLWYEIRFNQTTDDFYLAHADEIQSILVETIQIN